MNKLPIIEMAELNNYIVASDNYQNVFGVTTVDATLSETTDKHEGYTIPVRLNALFLVLVLQGEANVSLDYVHYKLTEDSFLTIMPSHIFQVADSSPDFKASLVMIDRVFFEEIKPEKRSPMMYNYLQLRNNPCNQLLPEETKHLNNCVHILQEKIRLRTHSFQREVIQNSIVGFLLELANILIGKNEVLAKPTLSRKEEIFNQFLQLLYNHVREHHAVTFYSDKLFITPQYLSLILKEVSGKSANKWIDEALMIEAKILLKMPQVTVQQVADQLNFSDQSTFGKFFKKHTGISPMAYRKS